MLFLKNFGKPITLLALLLFVGSYGYQLIEGWSYLDSIYMTLITITTVGFGEVRPLDDQGKLFTILLLLGGVIFYALTINSITKNLVDYSFGDIMGSLKLKHTISRLKNHYIICGGGRMAYTIGIEMELVGEKFVFIEKNTESIVSEHTAKWPVIQKDALLEDALLDAGILRAKGLASVLPTDADNLFVVLSARRLNPKLFIQTRIAMESTLSKMLQAGADKVVSPYTVGGLQIARSFLNPEVDDFLSMVTDRANYEFPITIHKIHKDDPNCNKILRNSDFRRRGLIVIGIRSADGNLTFAPVADFLLKEGLDIFLIGAGEIDKKDKVGNIQKIAMNLPKRKK